MWEMKKKWESEAREDQWSLEGLNEVVVISKKNDKWMSWCDSSIIFFLFSKPLHYFIKNEKITKKMYLLY